MDDQRLTHLGKLSLNTTKVNLDTPIIFLCGGQTDITKTEPLSVRDALLRHLAKEKPHLVDQITVAESIIDWIHDAIYPDLIEFENDIALISSLIIVILESAGSLTELGLFVKNINLKQKLLIFVNDLHYSEENPSFIRLGPLRHIEKINQYGVCSYLWCPENIGSTIADNLDEMTENVEYFLKNPYSNESFDKSNHGHIAYIIYELTRIFRALKFKEITKFLDHIGVKVPDNIVRRLIFLLKNFHLISEKQRGHDKFYFCTSNVEKIKFGGTFNKNNATVSALQFYSTHEKEKGRLKVINSVYNELRTEI